MYNQILNKLKKEVSGIIAYNHVAEISKHHRIQISPGIRDACKYALNSFQKYGIDSQIHSYPASGEEYDWTSQRFKEWYCKDAWLKLIKPEKELRYLARYDEEKIHVIQRSVATPPEGLVAQIAVPENKGEEIEDYNDIDVKGKWVLFNGNQQRVYDIAVEELGAIGLICDAMFIRPPNLLEGELDDSLKYTSFWWTQEDPKGIGFVVTPRTGKYLRTLVKNNDEPVIAQGYVDAKLYNGDLDNTVATIPGETDEEVIVIAHICHPQPSANDNASGCGAAIESARALNKLIEKGELPPPKRTIRFTLVPEMTGTYSYLKERENDIHKLVAAINLDMVGEDQDKTGSVLAVHSTPDSLPSYVNAVIESIFDSIKSEMSSIGGGLPTATFRWAVGGFSGGSDHYIYSDPTVGIPCPMIIQWPDKFYHTSADSIDKVSPESLQRVALLTATYAYFIANAGKEEAPWIASQTFNREKRKMTRQTQHMIDKATSSKDSDKIAEILYKLEKKILYDVSIGIQAIKSVVRISPDSHWIVDTLSDELRALGKRELKISNQIIEAYTEKNNISLTEYLRDSNDIPEESSKVPEKKYRGPISTRPWIKKLTKEDQEALRQLNKKHEIRYGGPSTQALYWTDGKRDLKEISRLLELETGNTNLEYLTGYYDFLEKMGLIKFV